MDEENELGGAKSLKNCAGIEGKMSVKRGPRVDIDCNLLVGSRARNIRREWGKRVIGFWETPSSDELCLETFSNYEVTDTVDHGGKLHTWFQISKTYIRVHRRSDINTTKYVMITHPRWKQHLFLFSEHLVWYGLSSIPRRQTLAHNCTYLVAENDPVN